MHQSCTFINSTAEAPSACGVCEKPRVRPSKQRDPWACLSCTLVNAPKVKHCLVCGTRRPKRREQEGCGDEKEQQDSPGSTAAKMPSPPAAASAAAEGGDADEEEEEDGHLAARERFVTSVLFPLFVHDVCAAAEAKLKRTQKQELRCLVCGKEHSTASIMRAHFVRTHLEAFGEELSADNAAAMAALRLQADERLALTLAQEQEDEEDDGRQWPRLSVDVDGTPGGGGGAATASATSSATSSAVDPRAAKPQSQQKQQHQQRKRRPMAAKQPESSDEDEEEEEEDEEAGPITRSGRTLVYSAAATQRHAVLRESMREMEARKQRRLEALVERTTALLGRLRLDIEGLVGSATGSGGAGGSAEEAAAAAAAASGVRPQRLQGATLRDYQELGVRWLLSLHGQQLNGILADEMGLGKTLQVLAFLCLLQERTGVWGPHLVVAPLSVLSSWEQEAGRVVAGVRCHTYHGEKEERKEAFNRALKGWREQAQKEDAGPVVVLTSYEMVLRDEATLRLGGSRGVEWVYLVADEAHRLKNRNGKLLAAMQSLRARHRMLLTGTPLQVRGGTWIGNVMD